MANTKCPKCNESQFEATPIAVRGKSFRPTAIQCTSCGTIVGLIPDSSEVEKTLGKSLADIQKAIAELTKKTGK